MMASFSLGSSISSDWPRKPGTGNWEALRLQAEHKGLSPLIVRRAFPARLRMPFEFAPPLRAAWRSTTQTKSGLNHDPTDRTLPREWPPLPLLRASHDRLLQPSSRYP